MNINEFQNLSREEQFAEAGRIAGVEPKVFDGIWRTESGRGADMVSPAGAEGHFGLMPKTRATWEGRFGAPIDPYNFGQSLFAAAHTLKENMGRFGNLPDSLRAYNGGWNPAKWGNPETAAYAAKVLGSDEGPAEDVPASTAQAVADGIVMPSQTRPAHDIWNTPAQGPQPRQVPSKPSKVAEGAEALIASLTPPVGPPTFDAINGQATAVVAKQDAAQKAKDETSFYDAMKAASSSGELIHQTARILFRDAEPIDPNFTPPEDVMKGKTEEEQRQLRAAGSKTELDRILFDQQDAKEQNEIVFRRGLVFGLGATMLAELPAAAFTGGITMFGVKATGYGALALAAQGRKAAALASMTAEGVGGNVLYTGLLDAMGQHQGAEQYALAAAGGLLTPLIGGRAIGREADRALEVQTALRLADEAKAKQFRLAETAAKNLGPNATPAELAAEMSRVEAEGIRADAASHKGTVPEPRRFNVGDQADLEAGNIVSKAEDKAPAGWGTTDGEQLPPLADTAAAREAYGYNVAAKWESKDMDAIRLRLMETDPEWQRVGRRMTDGMTWEEVSDLKNGVHKSGTLNAAMAENPGLAKAVASVEALAKEYLPGSRIIMGTGAEKGSIAAVFSVGRTHMIGFNLEHDAASLQHSALHELGHAIYHQNAPKASPRTLAMIDKDWLEFVNAAREGRPGAFDQRHAVTSPARGKGDPKARYDVDRDEYMAEQFVTHVQNRMLRGDYGDLDKGVANSILEALHRVLRYIRDVLKGGQLPAGEGAETFFGEVLRTGRMRAAKQIERVRERAAAGEPVQAQLAGSMTNASTVGAEVSAFLTDPIARKYGLDLLPMGTDAERATAKQIHALYVRADAWAAANPVDEKRLNKILSRFDSFDPTSNQMLRSANPVIRMVASELLENGGGAAGRRSSAAIAKYMNERAIIGNVINDMDTAFKLWHKKQPGASMAQEWLTGKKRVEFNRLVAEEIEQRRYPAAQTDFGQEVRMAADAAEASFERARLMQVDAKTVGWQALPETSRGYMPHRMRPDVVRSLTLQQKRAIHGALIDQFVGISGFDAPFADQLASKYLDRIQRRALGGFDAPVGLHQTGAADVVKEALEAMGLNRPELDAAMKRYVAGGAGHTKKRLNLDLRQSFTNDDGTTFRLMDLFDTDMLSLVRSQSQRVSGEVALARHGIMGKPGLAILRDAMTYGNLEHAAKSNEVEAFDAVAAEFLGSPFGTQNKWVDRAMIANSVASLGGMGFNQLGELINVGTTLGVKSALANVTGFGRLRSEVLKLAKGQKVDNPIIGSLEKFGGAEFGTDAYKMVFPMDLPDAPVHTMGADSLNAADRLMRGAGHLQSKLSLWRTITSVQQRGVAEQTVHAIMHGLRSGDNTFTLRDMGISDELLHRLRAELPNIAEFKGGRLTSLDVTKAGDVDAVNQLTQAVHRAVSQMIQGTFIGESGKYVHNSYLKMLTQFRSFSLTAIDKQWNRQAGNRGVAAALGMTIAAMSAAAPIYIARTYLSSIGRKDQQEYLDRQLTPGAIARATTNYIATSGLAGDFLDAFTAITGTGAVTGGRSGTNSQLVGNLIAPALGKADKVWGALQDTKDGTDVHGLIREMPLARLPWFIPAINALGN